MLKLLFITSICFFTKGVFGQYFEGKISYRLSCKSKVEDNLDEQMCSGVPGKLDYFIKNGNYKFIPSDSSTYQWMLYVNKENKIYNKISGSDTVFWMLGTEISDTILEVNVNKNVIKVLGFDCDEIIFTCTNAIHKLYYNSKISVDKNFFINHKYGCLYDFYKRSNSLVLKEILESEYSTIESIATEIKPMTIDEHIFKLPTNSIIIKSPY